MANFNGSKVGLVLGGGGAKGAFQLGVIKRIRELGMDIVATSGTSIGSFNSAFIGAGQIELLESLWLGGKLKNIITKVGFLGAIGSLLTTGSMFDVKTLKKFLLETLNWGHLGSKFCKTSFSFTSLNEKETKYYSNMDLNFNPVVAVDAIVGSMTIPLAYGDATVLGEKVVDGGFTEIVPVKQLTDMVGSDIKVIIIPCNNTESKVIYKPNFKGLLGAFETLIYAINDILWLEAERDDITNGKAKYWQDQNRFVVISPMISFIKSAADFDPEAIKAQYAHGYERAKAILG